MMTLWDFFRIVNIEYTFTDHFEAPEFELAGRDDPQLLLAEYDNSLHQINLEFVAFIISLKFETEQYMVNCFGNILLTQLLDNKYFVHKSTLSGAPGAMNPYVV